jgi:UDP-N-acetylglucosamine 1-carboxyvinyltransferase
MHGAIPKIDSAPWPGFSADMTSTALVVATQAQGTVLIHEKLFESRLFFADRLIGMGARIVLCDPHRAVVVGPSPLHGEPWLPSPDIRAGMALLIAALCAQGRSVIYNIGQIDRGYERIDERLTALGARIERVSYQSSE